jgi:hypothetical protein
MFFLNFLEAGWIAHAFVVVGLIGILASKLLSIIPFIANYVRIITLAGIVVFCIGIFLEGIYINEKIWQDRVEEMEKKVAAAEAKAKEENIKIVEKVITKTKLIKQKAEVVIKYVEVEVAKHDDKFSKGGMCEIPKEFIDAHNTAASLEEKNEK